MKKGIVKALLCTILIASFPVAAFAETWYSSDITLPRTGSWTTVTREATANTQKTKVTNNKYDVNARILNSGGKALSDYKKHQNEGNDDYGIEIEHKTGTAKGDKIKAEFKTTAVNYRTTTATLSWRP